MEVKLFSRFRSLREAFRMIEQDEQGIVHRRWVNGSILVRFESLLGEC
jgi:hypothetical protein